MAGGLTDHTVPTILANLLSRQGAPSLVFHTNITFLRFLRVALGSCGLFCTQATHTHTPSCSASKDFYQDLPDGAENHASLDSN